MLSQSVCVCVKLCNYNTLLSIYFKQLRTHVDKKASLALKAFLGLQQLGNTQRGLSFKALRQLYIVCIISIADFGVQL